MHVAFQRGDQPHARFQRGARTRARSSPAWLAKLRVPGADLAVDQAVRAARSRDSRRRRRRAARSHSGARRH